MSESVCEDNYYTTYIKAHTFYSALSLTDKISCWIIRCHYLHALNIITNLNNQLLQSRLPRF
uniref:SJCHGC02968 protein n=1 Tax=Schistosoma japonicum TaxID=6182 RepID=Q3MJW1_SCHJA|nr:SJCHGC02968 protein [Schistosoma japonicum]